MAFVPELEAKLSPPKSDNEVPTLMGSYAGTITSQSQTLLACNTSQPRLRCLISVVEVLCIHLFIFELRKF